MKILPGSIMFAYKPNEIKKYQNYYKELVNDGRLAKQSKEQMIFVQEVVCNSLLEATQFILRRGGNCVSEWQYVEEKEVSEKLYGK